MTGAADTSPWLEEELLLNRDGRAKPEAGESRVGPEQPWMRSPVLGLSCLLYASRNGSCGTMTRLGTSTRAFFVEGSCAGELSLAPWDVVSGPC
jgi:hypothetical protein